MAELADVSCGDAWLPELKHDKIGISIIVARTSNGETVLKQATRAGFLKLKPIRISDVVRSQWGNVLFKKYDVWARVRLRRSIGLPTPSYDKELPGASLGQYIKAVMFHTGSLLASLHLWPLLHIMVTIRNLLSL